MNSTPLYHVWEYNDTDREFWKAHLEDWLPEKIFDAHTHVQEPELRVEAMTDAMRKQYWVNEVLESIGAEDAQRCYRSVFPQRDFSCLAMGMPSLEFDVQQSNRLLSQECVKRGWKCLAVTCPQWPAAQVAEALDRPGVVGVKPYYALISHDPSSRDKHIEASIFDFLPHHQLEVLNSRRAWVTLHVPKKCRLCDPANIAEIKQIRRQYPDVILVIAHFGRCYTLPHAEQALPEFADDEGLYFDNSAVLNPDVHRLALEILGPNRIIYGTDNPVFYMRGRRQWHGTSYVNRTSYPFYFNQDREPPEIEATYTLYMYEALRAIKQACEDLSLNRECVENIFYRNATKLLMRRSGIS